MPAPRLFLAALLVALCLPTEASAELRKEQYGGVFGQTAVGNELGVTITNVWDATDAYPHAERFCSAYGKLPKFTRMDGHTASFDCVKA